MLADTTPALIQSGHVGVKVPCTSDADDDGIPETNIDVAAGVAPDVEGVDSEYVSALSDPDNNKCTFHVTIPEEDEDIIDVAIINTGDETVEFESGNFATISLTAADDHDDEAEDQDDEGEEREFRAELSGENEVPSVSTEASGEFEMKLGENGDIVVTLVTEGLNDGLSAGGTFDAEDLERPLEGQEMSDLIQLMEDGEAYVNVHTEENPGGEIRGQLEEEE